MGGKVQKDPEKIKEVCKIDQFWSRIPDHYLKTWLSDGQPETLVEAAKLADYFIATHKNYSQNVRNKFTPNSFRPGFHSPQTNKLTDGVYSSSSHNSSSILDLSSD